MEPHNAQHNAANEPKIVIIGAGPTGLGAAYRLKELGYKNFHMYERSDHLGGLASSFTDPAGFTWDIGGHVMFSHYKYYDECFDKLMGKDYQMNMRECWVRMFDSWVPYPFQNNIRHLPKEVTYECLAGLVKAQAKGDHKTAKNFREFIDKVFGEGIAKHFMLPYNFKVWAHPAEMMNKEWIGERVAVLDVDRAIKNVVMGTDDFGWGPNNQFKFPLYGGTGEFYRRFGPAIGKEHYTLNKKVDFINIAKKEVRFSDGEIVKYDQLITAMPLDKLCNEVINGEMPREIKRAAAGLRAQRRLHGRHRHQAAVPEHQVVDVLPRSELPVLPRHVPVELLALHDAGQGHALLAAVRDQLQRVQAGRRQDDRRADDPGPDQRRHDQGGGPQGHRQHVDLPRRLQLPDAQRRARRDPVAGDPVPREATASSRAAASACGSTRCRTPTTRSCRASS